MSDELIVKESMTALSLSGTANVMSNPWGQKLAIVSLGR